MPGFLSDAVTGNVPERCLIAFLMAKFRYEWFLFDYKKGYPDTFSKPFKTKAAAEKARERYPLKLQGGIGVGIVQIPFATTKRKPSRKA